MFVFARVYLVVYTYLPCKIRFPSFQGFVSFRPRPLLVSFHSHSHASISNHVVLNFLTLIDVSRLIFSPRPLLSLPYNLQLENTLAHLTYTSIFLSLANTNLVAEPIFSWKSSKIGKTTRFLNQRCSHTYAHLCLSDDLLEP